MSGIEISVSELTEVSKAKYLAHKIVSSFANGLVGIKVNLSNSLTPAIGWKIPVRNFIRNFGSDLGRTTRITHVRKYSSKLFTVKYLDDKQGREAIISRGVENIFDVKPVLELENGKYLEVFWYCDGGSDGQAEAEEHDRFLKKFFSENT